MGWEGKGKQDGMGCGCDLAGINNNNNNQISICGQYDSHSDYLYGYSVRDLCYSMYNSCDLEPTVMHGGGGGERTLIIQSILYINGDR